MTKYLKRLTALLLTFIMVLGIPISANAIQDWYGVSDPLQYTSDLHIGSYTYRAGTSSTVMRLDETNRIAYCIQPDVQIGGNESDWFYETVSSTPAWNALSLNQQRAINLLLLYGYPNQSLPGNKPEQYFATREIIWEIVMGYRDSTQPFTRRDARCYNAFSGHAGFVQAYKELESRYGSAQKETERRDAQARYIELSNLYDQLTSMGEIVKLLRTRIFVAERTQAELEDRLSTCLGYLESNGYKGTVSLNESKYEWASLYLPYSQQDKLPNRRYGQPVISETLAAGDPFNGADLSDPLGAYYGTTQNGGSIFLDLAFNDGKKRFSYNGMIAGTTGSGKSTFLKKAIQDRIARGDFVRGFDVTGEFSNLVKILGGKSISLDGSVGILNPLEIMKTDESDSLSWTRHISKMSILYRFWAPESDMYDVMMYEALLSELYLKHGIQIPQDGVPDFNVCCTGLTSYQYPILSDLLALIDNKLAVVPSKQTAVQKELMLDDLRRLRNVRAVVQNIVKNYGNIFNGHTSIENILDTQLVFFNIRHLASMKPEIFQAQLYSALSLCWDNALRVGMPMKNLYESQSIAWEDITRFFIVIDEAHRIVNANNLTAVQQLTVMAREDRKFFTGILMATQSILDCVPENSEKEGVEAIKTLFSLMQYKYMFQQGSDSLFRLKEIFGNQLTDSEYEQVPRLERGECIQVISGDQNYHYHVQISEEQRILFQGGA